VASGVYDRQQEAIHESLLFLDAFNERDWEAMRGLIADDVELRTVDGRQWRGVDGARELLETAEQKQWRLLPLRRGQHAEERGDSVWVEMRLRELIGPDDIERLADFQIQDRRVKSFALRPWRPPTTPVA
jgi:hypothetical protein